MLTTFKISIARYWTGFPKTLRLGGAPLLAGALGPLIASSALHLAVASSVFYLIGLIGWAMNGQLFSERTIDPEKRQRWGGRGYHTAAEHAQEGVILAVLQFVCGALYTGVQALLGRRI